MRPSIPARSRWRRMMANSFEALIALLSVMIMAAFLSDPSLQGRSVVGLGLGNWVWVWTVAYGVSGALILAGLWMFSARTELLGLCLLASGLLINALVTLSRLGFRATPQVGMFLAVGVACGFRAWSLYRGRDAYIVSHATEFYGEKWTRHS